MRTEEGVETEWDFFRAQHLTVSMGWLKDESGLYLRAWEEGFLSALQPAPAFPPALLKPGPKSGGVRLGDTSLCQWQCSQDMKQRQVDQLGHIISSTEPLEAKR